MRHVSPRQAVALFYRSIVVTMLLCLAQTEALAGREEAGAAYQRGNYAAAFKELKRLADTGDLEAVTMVGFMYSEGKGVPRDYAQAMQWYRKAADKGVPRAQHNLAVMYEEGIGVQGRSIKIPVVAAG